MEEKITEHKVMLPDGAGDLEEALRQEIAEGEGGGELEIEIAQAVAATVFLREVRDGYLIVGSRVEQAIGDTLLDLATEDD